MLLIPDPVILRYAGVAVGVAGVVWSGVRIAAGVASLSWSPTAGRVLARDIDDSGSKYQPVLEYSYEVHGIKYRGHRISFDFHLRRREWSTALLLFRKYPPGQDITVFVDLQRPYRSVVERGVSAQLVLSLLGGIGLIVYALTVF